jgi:uncharacterized protein YgfB (UPF0149 family)
MNDLATVDIDDLERMLKDAGTAFEAAEAHGAFCGRACLTGAAAIRDWQQELMAESDDTNVVAHECNRALEILAADTLLKLEAGDMRFALLLPGDDESLQVRTAALADWCHGFMHGLVSAGGADQGAPADALDFPDGSEILDDFSEITKAGASSDEGEESEWAYVELVEYVRVSVQLIYDETANLRVLPDASAQEH